MTDSLNEERDALDSMAEQGISVADAQAIKATVLKCVQDGAVESAFETAGDLIAAFQLIDSEVFTRSETERKLMAKHAGNGNTPATPLTPTRQ